MIANVKSASSQSRPARPENFPRCVDFTVRAIEMRFALNQKQTDGSGCRFVWQKLLNELQPNWRVRGYQSL